jgi:hypothetical protein
VGTTAIFGTGALGAQLLLGAGWIESRGRVGTGRALGRIGGTLLFLGAGALAAVAALGHVGAVLPLALAGPMALLAGLAGKPRPSGTVAATLYAIGLVVLAWTD